MRYIPSINYLIRSLPARSLLCFHSCHSKLITRVLHSTGTAQPDFVARFRTLDNAIDTFTQTLPPLSYSEDGEPLPTDRLPLHTRMILPHSLALSARINLHGIIALQDERSYQRCLNAAVDAMKILRAVEDFDFNYFEVALAVSCSRVLVF